MCSSGGPPAALQQWTSQPGVHRDGRTRRVGVLLLFSGNFHSLLAAQLLCSPPLTVICFSLYCSVSPFPVCLRFLKKCFLTPLSCFPTSPLSSLLRPPLVLLFTSVRPTWRWDSPWPSQENWEITLKNWLTLTVKSLFNSAMFRQATHTHTRMHLPSYTIIRNRIVFSFLHTEAKQQQQGKVHRPMTCYQSLCIQNENFFNLNIKDLLLTICVENMNFSPLVFVKKQQPSCPFRRSLLWIPQQPPGSLQGHADVRRSEILAGQREDPAAGLHAEEHSLVLRTGAVCRWKQHHGDLKKMKLKHNYFSVFTLAVWELFSSLCCFCTGQDTKLMQNCGKSTFKRTSVDRLMNVLVVCVSPFFQILLVW